MAIKPAPGPTPLASSSTTSASPSTHTLSFPAQTFAKLAPIPFLHAHLVSSPPRRPSGRRPFETRQPSLHTGSLSHASGSAVVRIGDTAVVCGIRAEILLTKDVADWKHPDAIPRPSNPTSSEIEKAEENEGARRKRQKTEADEIARLNLLVPNVELSTGCSPAHLPGSPPSDLAQTLSHRVLTLLYTSQLIQAEDLRIWHHPPPTASSATQTAPNPNDPTSITTEGRGEEAEEATKPEIKAYWTLHITLLFLSLDGSPFDAAWLALLAALKDVRLPRAWWDVDAENVLCSPLPQEATRLSLSGLPVPLTMGMFSGEDLEGVVSDVADGMKNEKGRRKWALVDMDGFEEGCVRETACLVVKGEGKGAEIVRIEKSGGGLVGRDEMRELVGAAGRRWKEWKGLLDGIPEDDVRDTEMRE